MNSFLDYVLSLVFVTVLSILALSYVGEQVKDYYSKITCSLQSTSTPPVIVDIQPPLDIPIKKDKKDKKDKK